VHPDLNTWFVRLGSHEHSVPNKLISSALYPNPKKHRFSETRLRLLYVFDVSVLGRVRDVTTFLVYMQGCKWAVTHRNGVPVGTFAAGTPFLFGINLLPKRSPANGTKIA